jgi:hypothetical protein
VAEGAAGLGSLVVTWVKRILGQGGWRRWACSLPELASQGKMGGELRCEIGNEEVKHCWWGMCGSSCQEEQIERSLGQQGQ